MDSEAAVELLKCLLEKMKIVEGNQLVSMKESVAIHARLDLMEGAQNDVIKRAMNDVLSQFISQPKQTLDRSNKAHSFSLKSSTSKQYENQSAASKLSDAYSARLEEGSNSQNESKELPIPLAESPVKPAAFGKLPAEIMQLNLSKPELMRLAVIYEWVDTEADYVRDLMTMINFHQREIQSSKLASDEDAVNLFSNVSELLEINNVFLELLQARQKSDILMGEIGDIIVSVADSLKVYTIYCGNYPNALRLVNMNTQNIPAFKALLTKLAASPEARGLSIESFLIKPVQRICKYPLLLRELNKYTPVTHKDREVIAIAIEKIDSVVSLVNESTKALGERDRMNALLSKIENAPNLGFDDRKVLKDGTLLKLSTVKSREKYILALSDMLLFCKPVTKYKSEYESKVLFYDCSFIGVKASSDKKVVSLNIYASDKFEQLNFLCSTEEERGKWYEVFAEGIRCVPVEMQRDFEKIIAAKKGLVLKKGKLLSRTDTADSDVVSAIANEEEEVDEDYGCGDQIWRKTIAATGQSYYFNMASKDTAWTLPEGSALIQAQ